MAVPRSGNLITSPQEITGSWEDVKDINTTGEIDCLPYSFFSSYIELDINDSSNVQFRYRVLTVSEGIEYCLPFETVKKDKILIDEAPFEVNEDIDQNLIVRAEIDKTIILIKLQVRALTVGATAGIINTATYQQGYRQ